MGHDQRTNHGLPVLASRGEGTPETLAVLHTALARQGRGDALTHGFHTYPARLHPHAAGDLLDLLGGETVLDPFCGGGTVLVEAMSRGARVEGADVSPVALLVAEARTSVTDEGFRTRLRSRARALTAEARAATALPTGRLRAAVEEWYAPHAAMELESLRTGIDASDEDLRLLLRAAWSSILVKVSWRVSDTRPGRAVHRRPPGTTAILFHKRIRELARSLEDLEAAVPEGTPPAGVVRRDARAPWGEGICDTVVTSPPYPGVYDYLPLQALREAWLGVEAERGAEIGARRSWRRRDRDALDRWREDTAAWIQRGSDALRPGGAMAIVVGDGLVRSGPVDAAEATRAAGERAGLLLEAVASAARPDHARDELRWEHAFVWRKAPAGG